MFESMTFESIMESMLANVPNDLDKREGSVIWDALAPAAVELETAYKMLDYTWNQSFADTADRAFLVLRARERGMAPTAATYAILKGVFVPTTASVSGKRFNLGDYNFQVGDAIEGEAGSYQMICETAGTGGNATLGTMIPIDHVEGLQSATATEVLIPGEDEEDTEAFRTRYLAEFTTSRFGGNIAQYIDWVMALDGVGGVRVARRTTSSRTITVTIIDSNYDAASAALIASVQNSLDPNGDGSGTGIAPIGHEVSVVSAGETTINVYIEVEFDTGYNYENMLNQIQEEIDDYLLEVRSDWGDYSDNVATIVRTSQIETRILALTGIIDVRDVQINGSAENYSCTNNTIPVLGVITHD